MKKHIEIPWTSSLPLGPQRHDEPRWKRVKTSTGSRLQRKMNTNEPRRHGKMCFEKLQNHFSWLQLFGYPYFPFWGLSHIPCKEFHQKDSKGTFSLWYRLIIQQNLRFGTWVFPTTKITSCETCSLGRSGVRIQVSRWLGQPHARF